MQKKISILGIILGSHLILSCQIFDYSIIANKLEDIKINEEKVDDTLIKNFILIVFQ